MPDRNGFGRAVVGTNATKQLPRHTTSELLVVKLPGDYNRSVDIARQLGGRLPTMSEFIHGLKNNGRFYRELEGTWAWSGEKRLLSADEYSRIDYGHGTVISVPDVKWYRLKAERRAYAYGGEGQVHIGVRLWNAAYIIVGVNRPLEDVAPLVVIANARQNLALLASRLNEEEMAAAKSALRRESA